MKLPSQPTTARPVGRNAHDHRHGSATVEFAVVVPILLILILGMIEYAQVVNVSQEVSSASRRGARLAARNTTRNVSDVENFVTNYIAGSLPQASGVQVLVSNGSGVQLSGSDLNSVSSGSPLAVEVALGFDTVRWFHHFVELDNKILRTTTTVRRE